MFPPKYHYCVPTALSILTGRPIEDVEAKLKADYLGDIEIKGIYIGLALKFLSDNGYHWAAGMREGSQLINCIPYDGNWIIEIHGHALAIIDHKIFDNNYPCGTNIDIYPFRTNRIIRAYRIIK